MDVGDAETRLCVMDAQKRILEERPIRTSRVPAQGARGAITLAAQRTTKRTVSPAV